MKPDKEPKWIWSGDSADDRHVWAWARRCFDLPERGEAALEICADLRYSLWINGRRIGFGPPKFHAATPTVDHYKIPAELLHEQRNVLAVLVYSLGDYPVSSVMPKRGGLWLRFSAGKTRIVSDRSWKMRRDPGYLPETAARSSCQPPCEIYDAGAGLGDPSLAEYNDKAWPAARELPPVEGPGMEARDIPFMTAMEYLPDRAIEWGIIGMEQSCREIAFTHMAKAISCAQFFPDREGRVSHLENGMLMDASGLDESEGLYALFDFGRLWAGYPILKVEGRAGTVIDLIYSEDLRLHQARPNKNPHFPYLDRIILGEGELSHRITWPKCARYIQLNVHGGAATVRHLALERSTYPVQWRGFFASDCPVLNQAWEISAHTVQLNMEDSYMDTPWRERGSWLGDDLLKCRAAYATFGDYALARRFLLHVSRGQRTDGSLASKYPANITSHLTTWTLCFPLSVFEYCRASGDWDFAREMLRVVKGVAGWLDGHLRPEGIYEAPPASVSSITASYNFIDWAPVDMRGANAAWNAFAYESLRCVAALAEKAGEDDFAEQTASKAAALKEAFCRVFWDEKRGIFVNGYFESKLLARWGCHENILSLLFGLAGPEQRRSIQGRLEEEGMDRIFVVNESDYDIVVPECGKISTVALALSCYRWPDDEMVPVGTPYFAGYLLRMLIESGRADEAQRFIRRHWGEFSRQGATSVWEVWDMEQSLSHGWSCSPVTLAAHYFLGVHQAPFPDEHFRILPVSGDLRNVRGRVATRFGMVQVEWSRSPDWTLHLDLPRGAVFEAGLPEKKGRRLEADGRTDIPRKTLMHCEETYQIVTLKGGRHTLGHV